jgi:hypothetical protein
LSRASAPSRSSFYDKEQEQAAFARAEAAADAEAAAAAEAKAKEEGLTVMEKKSSTVLDKALKEAMDHYKITVQRYWIVTLVGPDVRRLMENLEGILERVAKAILASGGDTEQVRKECKDFVERHMAVCRPLRVILRLMCPQT